MIKNNPLSLLAGRGWFACEPGEGLHLQLAPHPGFISFRHLLPVNGEKGIYDYRTVVHGRLSRTAQVISPTSE